MFHINLKFRYGMKRECPLDQSSIQGFGTLDPDYGFCIPLNAFGFLSDNDTSPRCFRERCEVVSARL